MQDLQALSAELRRIDGRGYKAYKDILGAYRIEGGTLFVDHVQADPFAAPSKLRIRCDQATANLPEELRDPAVRRIALEDFLARRVHKAIRDVTGRRRGSGKSGMIAVDAGGQEVLDRSAVVVTPRWVEARIEVGLPAAGRKVLGHQAVETLCQELPEIMHDALVWSGEIDRAGRAFVECVENHRAIADRLEEMGLVAFVADGAILPRRSGVSDLPMSGDRVVPFSSPDSMRVEMELPNPADGPGGSKKTITGMGVPKGVTLIVGGGYHGKSTLLRAIEGGVYPRVPGDGREYVVASPDAVKVRAEDRRRVERVALRPFIDALPDGTDTAAFSTEEASGSTSHAAAIIEAVEAGASTLLMDEDTCATNLLVRDARMQALVAKTSEPITPLLDRVQELYRELGVSTVMVMGGAGDYFDVADHVIMLEHYTPRDATDEAKRIAEQLPTSRQAESADVPPLAISARAPQPGSIDPSRGKKAVKIDAPGRETLRFGEDTVDLRCIEQLADMSQTRAIGHALHLAAERFMGQGTPLSEVLDRIDELLDAEGLDVLNPFNKPGKDGAQHPGRFARPRRHEIAAALNRLRSLRMRQVEPTPEPQDTAG